MKIDVSFAFPCNLSTRSITQAIRVVFNDRDGRRLSVDFLQKRTLMPSTSSTRILFCPCVRSWTMIEGSDELCDALRPHSSIEASVHV